MSRPLRTRQILAAHMLASGMSIVQVSTQMKLRRETLSRWKKNPEFIHEIQRAMGSHLEDAQRRVRKILDVSLTAIERGLNSYCDEPEKRVQVALSVLKTLRIDAMLASNEPENNDTGSETNQRPPTPVPVGMRERRLP